MGYGLEGGNNEWETLNLGELTLEESEKNPSGRKDKLLFRILLKIHLIKFKEKHLIPCPYLPGEQNTRWKAS